MIAPAAPPAMILPRTRFRTLLLASAALMALNGCDAGGPVAPALDSGATLSQQTRSIPKEPKLESAAPRYPAVAVYIVYREYVKMHPGLTVLDPDDKDYQKYMEKRLRELYPEKRGYDGMVADMGREVKAHRAAWATYEQQLSTFDHTGGPIGGGAECDISYVGGPECTGGGPTPPDGPTYADPDVDGSWTGHYEHAVPSDEWIPTVQAETDSLQLSPAEASQLTYYESLAATVESRDNEITPMATASRDDRIRAAAVGRSSDGPQTQSVFGFIGGVVFGYVGWHAYRAITADERAIRMSTQYLGHLHPQNTKRDAYRHIFWSMQLRRYLGAPAGKAITDYREGSSPGPASSTWMDYHNNDVGREYKYHYIRGHWFWDRNDSSEWAERIYNYVNNSANGVFISEWSAVEPTVTAARDREALVDNNKYIYFSNAAP